MGQTVVLSLKGFLGDLGVEIVAAVIVGLFGLFLSRRRIAKWRYELRLRKDAPDIIERQSSYQAHLRDVMKTFWRVRDDPPGKVGERIRREILEPIRGYIPTMPGEEIKIVWFRPTPDQTELHMYEQVGHTPEGQAAMRLPIGGGFAGMAFTSGDLVESGDLQADDRLHQVEKSKARGSIVCAPITRGTETTGVLSILSTCKDAFGLPDFLYFEALAAAIGALEVQEAGTDAHIAKGH